MSSTKHTELAKRIRAALAGSELFRAAVLGRCGMTGDHAPLPQMFPSTWKDLGSSEGQATDIFLRFKSCTGAVLALHGKLVRKQSKLTEKAAAMYPKRAEAMAAQLRYDEWCCVLFAPAAWIEKSPQFAVHFGAVVTLEEIEELGAIAASIKEAL